MKKDEFNPPYPIITRLGFETIIGITAGLFVSPFITCVDKAITQNAAGTETISRSMKGTLRIIVTKPHLFLRKPEQIWIWNIYATTYTTANCVDAFCKNYGIPHEMPKLWLTSMVNMTACILKDRAFVRMFGTGKPAPLPMSSYSFWATRDILTILSAFIVPSRLSNYLAKNKGFDKKKAETTITFWCPILLQIFSTPLHLLGLDCYNNRGASLKMRIEFLKRVYFKTVLARMGRMVPAFGIGGVINLKLRRFLFGDLDAKKIN